MGAWPVMKTVVAMMMMVVVMMTVVVISVVICLFQLGTPPPSQFAKKCSCRCFPLSCRVLGATPVFLRVLGF